jgi:hypothetical protein
MLKIRDFREITERIIADFAEEIKAVILKILRKKWKTPPHMRWRWSLSKKAFGLFRQFFSV